jgi:hypothetical protein
MRRVVECLLAGARRALAWSRAWRDGAAEPESPADRLVYRLRRWPKLPSSTISSDISRMLSVMSNRPVNRRWIVNNSRLQVHEVDRFLHRLVEQDAVEVTDTTHYSPGTSTI